MTNRNDPNGVKALKDLLMRKPIYEDDAMIQALILKRQKEKGSEVSKTTSTKLL